MLAITGLAPPSALRKTLIRSSVPSRVGTSTSRSMTTSAGGSVTVIGGLATPRTRSSAYRRAPGRRHGRSKAGDGFLATPVTLKLFDRYHT
ncbi:Uncharacterised protein [Mycobacterium tuberculosis]|uniref:Uncharacterized protein n=2 Tax=Mycobacterium tuberculosis TaxID=1773 RepID=A0A655I175_MYCTX|nr:Uncharacterised protein [Mycobacterium tuberculosis]CFE54471.1 Uncharacterised protein [Mycobacterium tuberculosis]CFS30593.1 Uncharacterised protein [Mycobacterium tuberculosis]CKQ77770.1 Uncharacterised protein [Mycobacterium tuberculosis]CKQ90886.1 Uncharacterised protein [Mycobacterium tuberculosis]